MNLEKDIHVLHWKVPVFCLFTLHLLFCVNFYAKIRASPNHRITSCSPQVWRTTMLPFLLVFLLKQSFSVKLSVCVNFLDHDNFYSFTTVCLFFSFIV